MKGEQTLGEFFLDPEVLHLNHGSYGAVPRQVHAARCEFQTAMEVRCSTWFREDYHRLLKAARNESARFLGGSTTGWAFVECATAACNSVILSQDLSAGDEVLFLSEIYGAVRKALRHWLLPRGVRLVEVPVILPISDAAEITDAAAKHLSPRTRFVVLDHITSPSAMVLPVAELIRLCRENGARILIDGAHAPGHLPLDVPALGVDYYTGNAHKWLFAPKGCGVLWAAPSAQPDLHPNTISHGWGKGWQAEFDWIGTRDVSPWLSLPAAIEAWRGFGGPALMERNRNLAREAGEMIAEELKSELSCPKEMGCSMATICLPGRSGDPERHKWEIARRHNAEVQIVPWNDGLGVRISAQVYNDFQDYERSLGILREYFELQE